MTVSSSLDPDQARQFVGPDRCPIYLQRLSVDDTRWQRLNKIWASTWYFGTCRIYLSSHTPNRDVDESHAKIETSGPTRYITLG